MQKTEKLLKPWHMGAHLRILSKSFPVNINMTGMVFKNLCVHVRWMKVALALEHVLKMS